MTGRNDHTEDDSGVFHRTGFIYQVWKIANSAAGRQGFALSEGRIASTKLKITADEIGAGPAD
jgi:hypothetical protein